MTTYYVNNGATGAGTGLSWADACVSMGALQTAITSITGGDVIKVHKTHSNSYGGATSAWVLPEALGSGNVAVVVVDKDASDALSDGALEESGSNTVPFSVKCGDSDSSSLFVHGMTFRTGAGGSSAGASHQFGQGVRGKITFSDCTFVINNSNTGSHFYLGSNATATAARLEFYNCKFKFGHSAQRILLGFAVAHFYNCLIDGSGSTPAAVFSSYQTSGKGVVECHGCNWSGGTTLLELSNSASGEFRFVHCATASATLTTGTPVGCNGVRAEFVACGPADAVNGPDVLQLAKVSAAGPKVETTQAVYKSANPSQGTQDDGTATSYSYKFTPGATVTPYQPLYGPWIAKKASATGSLTVSLDFADTEAGLLKTSELGIEVCYMGGANLADSPQNQFEVSAPVQSGTIYRDPTAAGSNLTDTTVGWTGVTPGHTYTISKTVTVDYRGYLYVRGALYKNTTNPVYMDGTVTVA